MLLMSSMLVLLTACATEWSALLSPDDSFWAMMRVWLVLAAHQMAFVAGSCEAIAPGRTDTTPAQAPQDRGLLDYDARRGLPGG